MLPIIDLTSNRSFNISNFNQDKKATLNAHTGLVYCGFKDNRHIFRGVFNLCNPEQLLIQSFNIKITLDKTYPYTFPSVILLDGEVERSDDYHISSKGVICLEHPYVANTLAKKGIKLYDFVNYYLPKYFSWVLVKKYGNEKILQEWAHAEDGTKQIYMMLLDSNDDTFILSFLTNYCNEAETLRNSKCYCNSNKKLKNCHYEAVLFLDGINRDTLLSDIGLFK